MITPIGARRLIVQLTRKQEAMPKLKWRKERQPIMTGSMLYLKILASFDGKPNQLLSKVIWYHKE
jgi:hypothetical protein